MSWIPGYFFCPSSSDSMCLGQICFEWNGKGNRRADRASNRCKFWGHLWMRSYKISHWKNILDLTISFGFLSQMPFTTVSIVWKSNDQVTHLQGVNDQWPFSGFCFRSTHWFSFLLSLIFGTRPYQLVRVYESQDLWNEWMNHKVCLS